MFETDGHGKTDFSRVTVRISESRMTAPDIQAEREIIPEKVQAPDIPAAPAAKPAPAPEAEAVYSEPSESVPSVTEAAVSEAAAAVPDFYTPPVFLEKIDPAYPPTAVKKGLEGTVILLLEIDENGNLAGSEIVRSSGHRLLDKAALRAAEKCTFMPGKKGGKAVSGSVKAEIIFELE